MTKQTIPCDNEIVQKKLTTFISIFVLVVLTSFISQVVAQETQSIIAPMPPYDGGMPSQPFGQTHAYTVTLRGNAEAVVSMKTIFTNYSEATISAMTLQNPKGEIENISAYQVIREPQCIYAPQQITNNLMEGIKLMPTPYKEVCVEYSDPDYYGGYYYGNSTYVRANVEYDGEAISVTLPKEVSPQKSGSIVLYYRVTGLVNKDAFGAFSYSFETLKIDSPIRSLSVGVNTDSEFQLEGTDTNINYDMAISSAPMLATAERDMKQGVFVSPEFDSYYQQIGYGSITKTAADLQPYDSFTVDGRYAKNRAQLYGKKITIASLLGIGFLLFIIAIIYRVVQSFSRNRVITNSKVSNNSFSGSALMAIGIGFVSSLMVALYTIGLYAFFTILERSYYSQANMIIVLFVVLISCLVYILFTFGPAVFVGWRRGVWWGVGTIATTILLLCIYLGVGILYMFFINQHRVYPTFMNMRDASSDVVPSQESYMK